MDHMMPSVCRLVHYLCACEAQTKESTALTMKCTWFKVEK